MAISQVNLYKILANINKSLAGTILSETQVLELNLKFAESQAEVINLKTTLTVANGEIAKLKVDVANIKTDIMTKADKEIL